MANNPSKQNKNTDLLPVIETITLSWEKVSGAKKTFWAAIGIFFVIAIAFQFILSLVENVSVFISLLFSFAFLVVNFLLQGGLMYIGIVRAKGMPITYKLLFRAFNLDLALKLIGVYILQILVILIPEIILIAVCPAIMAISPLWFVLGVILGIVALVAIVYLFVRMILSVAFVLDKELKPVDALKRSFCATRSNIWNLIGLSFLQMLIIIVSAIPLGIGLIWTLPLGMIIYGMAYKKLSANL